MGTKQYSIKKISNRYKKEKYDNLIKQIKIREKIEEKPYRNMERKSQVRITIFQRWMDAVEE